MAMLRLRFRFPDGRQVTLNDVRPTDTYGLLLKSLQTAASLPTRPDRVLIAGPPPRPVHADDTAVLGSIFSSGQTLIVEPPKRGVRPRRRAQRAAAAASKQTKGGSVVGLRDLRRQTDAVDSGEEWTPDTQLSDDDGDDDDVKPVRTVGRKRSRAASSAASGRAKTGGGVANVATLSSTKRRKTRKKDAGEVMEALMGEDARGMLGAELAKSVAGDGSQLDECGKSFRNSLQSALQDRQREAEGERRYQAWLAKRYEIIDAGGRTFKVRYRALDARTWTEEAGMFKLPRELLAEAFRDVLKNEEHREGLRVLSMAIMSPRSFWNMVRLFGEGVEEGLMGLVPESDWSFIKTRRRRLSEKAKRNLKQSADVIELE
ncbi:hypothetical protein FGB62_22g24 [Gracilaria domingensis]|nr:hypothetical protein FGB62_22g24 [Gracilaria domingensis]